MSEPAAKARAKAPAPAVQRAPAKAPAAASAGARAGLPPGLLQAAGPALGLGVQRQVAVGEPGDRFEREADAAADRVSMGESVEPASMSPVTPQALAQTAAEPAMPEKKPEATPVQKAEAMPEKKPEATPVQKAEAMPEKQPEAMPVQKAAAAPEKKPEAMPVQKAEATPEKKPEATPVQKAEAMPETKPVQTDAAGSAPPAPAPSMSAVASEAVASKGAGRPLEPAMRGTLESRLGADLSDVRVHDDSAAQSSARALNARAFTHGSDIWLGPGASQNDTRLMAHEATHVVQQSGGAHRMVQRANGGAKGGTASSAGATPAVTAPGTPGAAAAAQIDVRHEPEKKITFPTIELPGVANKTKDLPQPLEIPKVPDARTNQRQNWQDQISGAGVSTLVDQKLPDSLGLPAPSTGGAAAGSEKIFYLKLKQQKSYLIGRRETLKQRMKLPNWSESGSNARFDVDHVRELQLGGKDTTSNYQLLDFSANRSSGSKIMNEIRSRINSAVAQEEAAKKPWPGSKDPDDIRRTYGITFTNISPTMKISGSPELIYTYDDVANQGKHLQGLDVLNAAQVTHEGIRGGPGQLVVYTSAGAGAPKQLSLTGNGPTYSISRRNWAGVKGFDLTSVTYTPGQGGTITGEVFNHNRTIEGGPLTVELDEVEGLQYTAALRTSTIRARMRNLLKAKQASPIELDEADFTDGGVSVHGVLRPTLPFLRRGLDIDIAILGDDITLSTTLTKNEFNFPGPIKVTQGSLTLSAGSKGLGLDGDVSIEIEHAAKGRIHAAVGTEAGLDVEGELNFDSKLFDPAQLKLAYVGGEFSASGQLRIPPDRVRGIKSATITASFAEDTFKATGMVEPDIPVVESAGLVVEYNKEAGLKFAGDLKIKADTPGIAGGSIHVEALQPPGSETFKVKGTGTAKPKIPGFDTELNVSYDDGTFDASVTASYNKGRLKGSAMVGATNRPVADGKPTGPAPEKGGGITVYGGGSVTIVIAPWLQGTVGVRLLPKGEIELSGEIALPASLDVFPEKKLDKNIFTIGIDIPIVGVAVAGQRIGIFANISGGLDVGAGIGPGQLQQLRLKITYNPAHEEDTHVQGDASLHVPAHAGLRLFVRGGLGAGIPIVSAQAGLEIGAGLGLEGALDTGVHVDWTPAKGLTLDAEAAVYVEPKLKVDITGFVKVDADLFITTVNLYEKRWQLAGFEYGSGLRFGVSFPVHYQEGQPFDLSLDKVKFQVPEINPKAMLSDLIARIA